MMRVGLVVAVAASLIGLGCDSDDDGRLTAERFYDDYRSATISREKSCGGDVAAAENAAYYATWGAESTDYLFRECTFQRDSAQACLDQVPAMTDECSLFELAFDCREAFVCPGTN